RPRGASPGRRRRGRGWLVRWACPPRALLPVGAPPAAHAGLGGRRVHFADGRLRDQRGREVTLRGVNARVQGIFDDTFTDGRLPLEPLPVFDAGDADAMRSFGFNLLRLPISWSGLEPTPGVYDR